MELSMFEIALLAWCFIATSGWIDAKGDARALHRLIVRFIEDPKAREVMIEAHEKSQRIIKQNATN